MYTTDIEVNDATSARGVETGELLQRRQWGAPSATGPRTSCGQRARSLEGPLARPNPYTLPGRWS
ncbi:hypothetical protein Scep_014666 [Stephania cephalantha]|uniref:Uncharacterized protein n=1 Tax=Stephania cephalantha TaxID=152367 RepID=A0AAP0J329_9MAGN